MKHLSILVVILLLSALCLSLSGCDFSARWDLKRAEKALKQADEANAEFWAEPEYRKAQQALVEAMKYAEDRLINESRDAAEEARSWAEEATELAIRRKMEMEEEHDALNRKDY